MKKHLFSLLAALSMFAVLILPASAEIALSARSSSLSNGGRTVTVELSFTCAFEGGYDYYGTLIQNSGRLQNYSYSSDASGYCEAGEEVTMFVEFPTQRNLAFKPGPAQLDGIVYLESWDFEQYDNGSLTTTIRLKK